MADPVLVTGGAGYIGLHTVRRLRAAGVPVVALDRRPVEDRGQLAGAEFESADVRDEARVEDILRRHHVAAVIHCAALKSAPESVQDPAPYFDTNVGGSLALMSAMTRVGVGRMVFSSSCGVYGTPTALPVTEASALGPENPYAETKVLVERMLPWFESAHGIRFVALRYFNAAGVGFGRDDPGQAVGEDPMTAQALIPAVVRAAAGGVPVTIFGNDYPTRDGTAVRDFVHVADVVDGHLLALDALREGHSSAVVNLGSGRGTSVREVVDAVSKVIGRAVPTVDGARRAGDPAEVWADRTLAEQVLGWRPQHALDDMIESTWVWQQRAAGASEHA
jgi:UDP-glucose-4-epimerase GalE